MNVAAAFVIPAGIIVMTGAWFALLGAIVRQRSRVQHDPAAGSQPPPMVTPLASPSASPASPPTSPSAAVVGWGFTRQDIIDAR